MKTQTKRKFAWEKTLKPSTANIFLSRLDFLIKSRDKNPIRMNSVAMNNVKLNTGV